MLDAIIILSILLFISLAVNVCLVWYLIGVLKRLLLVSENLGDLVSIVSNFRGHVKSVYELEAFYGEPVLETLLKHAGALSEVLEEFEEIYTLTEEEDIEEDIEQDTEQEEENPGDDEPPKDREEPQATEGPIKGPKKTIFHSGP